MRALLLGSAAVAVVATSLLLPPAPLAAANDRAAPQGFCRTAAPLPQIGNERNWQAEKESRDIGVVRSESSGRDRVTASPVVAPPPVASPPAPPPPAPPPPMVAPPAGAAPDSAAASDYSDEEGGDVVVTGSRIESRSPSAIGRSGMRRRPSGGSVTIAPPPRPHPQPQPQSGLLTAGEHDDLLNPELYAAYVRRSNLGQAIPDLPRVDTMNVVTVRVVDTSGRAVPFANVKLTCSDGNSISMATQADGDAIFFPGLDRLSEQVTVSIHRNGEPIVRGRPILVSNQPGGQVVGMTVPASGNAVNKLDMMFVIDTTGSMGDEIRYLQSELRSIINTITAKHRGVDIRLGFVFYRDEGDDYVTYSADFDRDIGKQQGVLAKQSANGGGDYPEAMDQALIRAVGHQWRGDAVKSMFLLADAPPHDQHFGRTWLAAEAARAKRIHITPIAASGVADKAEYAMRAMAAATQSRYLFLTDDSGVGNAHAAPAVDCYLVTRLDALVRRVVDSQLSGRRVEPEKQEVIRSVGNYDAGKCLLPSGYRWDQG